jgi:hypothetical protein
MLASGGATEADSNVGMNVMHANFEPAPTSLRFHAQEPDYEQAAADQFSDPRETRRRSSDPRSWSTEIFSSISMEIEIIEMSSGVTHHRCDVPND